MTKKKKQKQGSSKKADSSKAGDVADQTKLLEELRESEEMYRSIFELSPEGIVTVDLKGVITTCNPVFLELIGYSEEDIIGKHFSKIPALPAVDIPLYTKMLASLIRGKKPESFEAEWIHENGTVRTGDVQVGLIKRRKKIMGLQAIVRDITEQKQAEEVLREEKAFTEAALNSQIDTFYIFRVDDSMPVRWNSFFEEVSEYSDEEISSMVPFDFYPETEHESIKTATKKILKTGQTTIELTLTSKNGKSIPYEYVATLIKDEKGDPLYICSIGRDISERKQAEEELRQLTKIVEQSTDSIITMDPEYRITYINAASQELFGWSLDEIKGKTPGIFNAEPLADDIQKEIYKTVSSGNVYIGEALNVRKDGSTFICQMEISPILDDKGDISGYMGSRTDITDRKQAEEALQESETRYRSIFEDSPISLWEEDYSKVKQYLDDLREQGVTDFRQYFEEHNEAVNECTNLIEILNVNDFTLEMYKVESKEALLGILSKIFPEEASEGMKEELIALAEGQTTFEKETTTLAIDGERLILNLKLNIPPGYEETWSKVIVSIIDITERKQAEDALRETRDTLATVMDSIEANVYVLEIDTYEILFANKYIQESLSKDLVGKVCYDIFRGRSSPCDQCGNTHLLDKKGQPTGVHRWEDQSPITGNWYENFGRAIPWHDGRFVRLQIAVDITERKKAEDTSTRLGRILEDSQNEIYIFDPETLNFLQVNRGARDNLGYSLEELSLLTPLDLKPEFTPESFNEQVEPLRTGEKKRITFTTVHKRKDGSLYPVEVYLQLISHESTAVFVAIIQDITEHKQAEKALKESEEKYRNLVERANDGVLISQEGIVKFVNSRITEMFGYTVEEMVDTNFINYVFPDERPKIMDIYTRRIQGEDVPSIYEMVGVHKDGSGIPVEINSGLSPFQGKSATFSFVRDITGRKKAEEELQQYAYIVSSSTDMLAFLDKNFFYLAANDAYLNAFGIPRNKLIAHSVSEIFGKGFLEKVIKPNADKCLRGEEVSYEEWFDFPEIGKKYMEINYSPYKNENDEISGFVVNGRDITERKQAEEEKENLLASEGLQRTMAETLSEVTLALTSHTDVSSVLEEILKQIRRIVPYETANIVLLEDDVLKTKAWYGYEAYGSAEFVSNLTHILSDFPVDAEVIRTRQPRVIPDASKEPKWQIIKETNWIKSLLLIPICLQDRVLGVIRLDGGEVDRFSEEDAERLLPLASSAAVALENASLYEQAQQELIEREQAEKEIRRLNEELEQRVIDRTNKLKATNEELEAFSYSISHDLRAPLRAINGFSAILKDNYGELLDEEGNRYLDILRDSTLKMDHLINDLLSLSRLGRREISFQPVNITAMVERVYAEQTKDEIDRGFDFQVAYCPIVEADNQLLEILLTNLLSNAVKFTRGRDPAVIEFGWLGEEDAPVYYVRDNGVGFNMAYMDNLFGPFQRLHSEKDFEGTGIGLAIVRRITQRHSGRVWVEAEPDKGATFYFTLG